MLSGKSMKPKLKINFVDFWLNFQKNNNYFYHLLSQKYSVEINEDDPDLLFFSVDYANQKERDKYKDHRCKKVFYTGEGVSANFDNDDSISVSNHGANYSIGKCDFAFTFDFSNDPRNYRLPLWALHIDWFDKGGYTNPRFLIPLDKIHDNQFIDTPKTKFCATIFSNPVKSRIDFYNKLSLYKPIDGFGKPFGNWTDGEDIKYKILKDYKFSLCFENNARSGYFTEKLFHAKIAGTIPIYFSNDDFGKDFNEECCLNLCHFETREHLLEKIVKVDNDRNMYRKIFNQPLFIDNKINQSFYPENVLDFFDSSVLK